jgi:mono/diheme cytochrome c family protein
MQEDRAMKVTRTPLIVAGVATFLLAATPRAGGWAIVTVRALPEWVVVGKPFELTFTARQHGVSPLDGLEPQVTATSDTGSLDAPAISTKSAGEYTATLVLPRPGTWTIAIDVSKFTLPPVTAISPGSPAPAPLPQTAVGERLFVAKGCIGCHVNREVQAEPIFDVGPDLTGKRFPETYLKRFLAKPQTLGRTAEPEREEMPDLHLTTAEIAALTAFINRERPR